MNKTLFIILTLLVFSCKYTGKDDGYGKEQKIFDRIEFVYNLKQTIAEKTWATFNDKEYDLPLVYFTDTSSYIVNPTEKFLKTFKSDLVFQNQAMKIFKTKIRVDSLPFHMETGMTLGDPTAKYNYHSPFMMCSSYEETYKTIPTVLSTEEWTTMIIHEYFHGYQYKHKPYIDYYEKEIVQIQPDSLITIYNNNTWFKNAIDKENELLLKAITETDRIKIVNIINDFFALRTQRRKTVLTKMKFDISKYEKCYETMEGTARYIEYSLYKLYATKQPDYKLLKSDTSFRSFEKFRNYDITKDEWLYKTEKTTYFYAIGFNMARLLDKLKIEYKSRLFKEGKITMEDILLEKQNGR
jgi:hypothetical protein